MQVPRSHTENIYLWDQLKEINATKWLHFCSLFPLCAAKVNLRTFIHWRLRGAEKLPWSSGHDLNSGHHSLPSRPVTLLGTFCLIIQRAQNGSTRMHALISSSLKMCRWRPVRRARLHQWHDYLGRCQGKRRKAPIKQRECTWFSFRSHLVKSEVKDFIDVDGKIFYLSTDEAQHSQSNQTFPQCPTKECGHPLRPHFKVWPKEAAAADNQLWQP